MTLGQDSHATTRSTASCVTDPPCSPTLTLSACSIISPSAGYAGISVLLPAHTYEYLTLCIHNETVICTNNTVPRGESISAADSYCCRLGSAAHKSRALMPAAAAAPAEETSGISEYEQFRLDNIKRNEEMLRALGISVSIVTSAAQGRMAPTASTRRRRAVPKGPRVDDGSERRSARNVGRDQPDYADPEIREGGRSSASGGGSSGARAVAEEEDAAGTVPAPATKRQKILHANRTEEPPPKPVNSRSCKNLNADVDGLHTKWLGEIIPPMGGQVKRAAMEAASAEGPPSFSRMSGTPFNICDTSYFRAQTRGDYPDSRRLRLRAETRVANSMRRHPGVGECCVPVYQRLWRRLQEREKKR